MFIVLAILIVVLISLLTLSAASVKGFRSPATVQILEDFEQMRALRAKSQGTFTRTATETSGTSVTDPFATLSGHRSFKVPQARG